VTDGTLVGIRNFAARVSIGFRAVTLFCWWSTRASAGDENFSISVERKRGCSFAKAVLKYSSNVTDCASCDELLLRRELC
jgi:hypothetical protein